MKKGYLKNWRKLDNTAKSFSLTSKNDTNIFRYSVILKRNVDKIILKKAVEKSLEHYKAFKVRSGTGLFWNYLEFNSKEIIVKEENEIPCEHINFKKNNEYLFKVTYYKKKINLEIFHALTDGAGASKLLKSIIYNYLSLKYNISFEEDDYNISFEDQYLKNYDKDLKFDKSDLKPAYQIPGKINKNINNTYHYVININDIKDVCGKYGVTITEYLTAMYIYALYTSIYNKELKKEIVIDIPINLRKYYKVDTLSNFFVCMKVNSKILEGNLTTFEEILDQVHEEFQKNFAVDKIKSSLTRDVKLGLNLFVRLLPLFVKKRFIKVLNFFMKKTSTSTLSNVGVIDIDDRFKKYIDNILLLVMPGKVHKIKCTVCSFDNNLNVTMNSNIDDIKFQREFYRLLKSKINNIKLESNNCVDDIKRC